MVGVAARRRHEHLSGAVSDKPTAPVIQAHRILSAAAGFL